MFKKITHCLLSLALLIPLAGCAQDFDMGSLGKLFKPKEEYGAITTSVAQVATPEVPPAITNTDEKKALPATSCLVSGGTARFTGGWFAFDKTAFSVAPGEQTRIIFPRRKSDEELILQVYFDEGGQKIIFCPMLDAAPDEEISCSSLYALEDDFTMGIKRTFDVPDAVRGGSITCAYDKAKLKKL